MAEAVKQKGVLASVRNRPGFSWRTYTPAARAVVERRGSPKELWSARTCLSGGAESASLTPHQRQLVFDMQFELFQANFLELLIL